MSGAVDCPTPDDAPVMSTTRGLGMSDLHTLGSEQDSEHKGMRHEEKRHEHRRHEVRGTLQAGCDPYAQSIALIERVEQIHGTDDVEQPHDDGPRRSSQGCDRGEREK